MKAAFCLRKYNFFDKKCPDIILLDINMLYTVSFMMRIILQLLI